MMFQFALMTIGEVIGSGLQGLVEDTGKTQDELYEVMSNVHQSMNAAARKALESEGYSFTNEDGNDLTWNGTGAGILSMIYLMHANQTLELVGKQNGQIAPDGETGLAN